MNKPTSQTPNLTEKTQSFVDSLAGGKPLYELSPEEARQVLLNLQNSPAVKPVVEIRDVEINVGSERKLKIRLVRPEDMMDDLPVVFYVHGGGWVMGNEDTHDRLIRELAVRSRCAVVFPVYTLAPNAQYPTQLEELYAALEYIMLQSRELKLDTEHMVIAGDSVGGNMAVVLALMAKENRLPRFNLMLLFYPVAGAEMDTRSYQDFAEGPWLTKKAMEWFWDQYLPDAEKRGNISASPINAPMEKLNGLPPALIITAENDVLRDEGEALAKKLAESGVRTISVRVEGTIHDFMMLDALADTEPVRSAMYLAETALNRVFERDVNVRPEISLPDNLKVQEPACKNMGILD